MDEIKPITIELNRKFVIRAIAIVISVLIIGGVGFYLYSLDKRVTDVTVKNQQVIDFINQQIKATKQ